MLAVSMLAEDSEEEDEPTHFSSKEALQILQLQEGSSRDVIKEQYLKLATPFHPDRTKNDENLEFRKLTHALYAALFNSDCSICNNSNCKECWQVKELVWDMNCLGQDLDEEEHEGECNELLYYRTLEKYLTNLTFRKKSKERIPSKVLSEKDEEILTDFLKSLIVNKGKKDSCPKCKTEKKEALEEVDFAEHLAQIGQNAPKTDGSRQQHKKKGRKGKGKSTQDNPRGKSLSKSAALQLDNKRKHEMEDIRKELMKVAKLAEEPKHQLTHIAVRREIIDKESQQEIERQRQEKENKRLELQKKMKKQAAQEAFKNRKLKRNNKKKPSLDSSSSSAYPSSLNDTSWNTSSNFSSMDSSTNEEKDERQTVELSRPETVAENPLFEDRKRGANNPEEMPVEEAKKLKLSEEGEPSSIDSGYDKNKEKVKPEHEDERKKRNQRKKEKAKERKMRKKISNNQSVQDSGQLEESRSSSFVQIENNQSMETDISTDHSVESNSCQLRSMSSSSIESPSHPQPPVQPYSRAQASNNQLNLTYADVTAASVNQVKAQPVRRSPASEVSVPPSHNASYELKSKISVPPSHNASHELKSKISVPPSHNASHELRSKISVSPSHNASRDLRSKISVPPTNNELRSKRSVPPTYNELRSRGSVPPTYNELRNKRSVPPSHNASHELRSEVSVPPNQNTSHELRLRSTLPPQMSSPHLSQKISTPPGFRPRQPPSQMSRFPPTSKPVPNSYISSHTFSQRVPQQFTFKDMSSQHMLENQVPYPRMQPTQEDRSAGIYDTAKGFGLPKVSDIITGAQNNAELINRTTQDAGEPILDVQENETLKLPNPFENATSYLFSTHQTIPSFQNSTSQWNTGETPSINMIPHEKLQYRDSVSTTKENLAESAVEELDKKLQESLTLTNSKVPSSSNVDMEIPSENKMCSLNQRHIPDHWDDSMSDGSQEETIQRHFEKSHQEATRDTFNKMESKQPRQTNDFSNIKKNLKSIRHIVRQNISTRQRDKSENANLNNKDLGMSSTQNLVLASFEKLDIKDNVEGDETKVTAKTDVCSKTDLEDETKSVLSEKSKKWKLLAPHNAKESGEIEVREENERKHEKVRMRNDSTQYTSRTKYDHKDISTTRSTDSTLSRSIYSSCQPHTYSGKEGSNASLLEKVLRTGKPQQVLRNPYVLSSKEVSAHKSHETTSSEEDDIYKAIANLKIKDGKENWSLGTIDNSQAISLSKNFISATQSHQNGLQFDELFSRPPSDLSHYTEPRKNLMHSKDRDFVKSSTAESKTSNSDKFQERKILHPMRRPRTVTQCMQASQLGGIRDKTASKDSWLELFTFDKSQSSNVSSKDKEKPPTEERKKVQDEVKTKRATNPLALFQNALSQVKEERGLSPKSRNTAASQSGKDECSVRFPSRPALKTVDKLPKLNISGMSSF